MNTHKAKTGDATELREGVKAEKEPWGVTVRAGGMAVCLTHGDLADLAAFALDDYDISQLHKARKG